MTFIDFRPIVVDTGTSDREGCLALVNGQLVAVLTRLDLGIHSEPGHAGQWHVEVAFPSHVKPPRDTLFADLDQCRTWLAARYG